MSCGRINGKINEKRTTSPKIKIKIKNEILTLDLNIHPLI